MNDAHGISTDALADLVAQQERQRRAGWFGKYRGMVFEVGTEKKGNEKRIGQVRAQVPDVSGDSKQVNWANPALPFAGNGYGFLMAPKVGDGVWIEYEGGNLDKPIWSGGWWPDQADLPDPVDQEVRVIRSSTGHRLVFDDKSNTLTLEHKDGQKITLTSSAITIEVKNGAKIELSSSSVKINDSAFEVQK